MAILANKETVKFEIGTTRIYGLKALPDFAENKEQVEVTTLANTQKRYIAGLKDFGELAYTFNYDPKEAKKVKDNVEGTVKVTLADGTEISYPAELSLAINAASSGAVMEMTVNTIVKGEIKVDLEKGSVDATDSEEQGETGAVAGE